MVRDWSIEGREEREKSYGPIKDKIQELFGDKRASVLVPGSGLNRLAFDLAAMGYRA
jgi:carnosine N-methyltransferase